jgi:hypothetical protein
MIASGVILEPHLERLKEIAADRSQMDDHRALAASTAMIAAEIQTDSNLAREALARISDVNPCTVRTIGPFLIYETSFGSSALGAELARRLVNLIRLAEHPSRYLRWLDNCALALWRCGDSELAKSVSLTSHEIAATAKLRHRMMRSAGLLSDIAWTLGHRDEAEQWFATAARLEGHSLTDGSTLPFLAVGILLALDAGDPARAEGYLREAESRYPAVILGSFGLDHLAYSTRIKLATGSTISDDEIDRLKAGHLARRAWGQQDVVADTLFACLAQLDRVDEASRLRTEYLSQHRRDRHPIPVTLKHLG